MIKLLFAIFALSPFITLASPFCTDLFPDSNQQTIINSAMQISKNHTTAQMESVLMDTALGKDTPSFFSQQVVAGLKEALNVYGTQKLIEYIADYPYVKERERRNGRDSPNIDDLYKHIPAGYIPNPPTQEELEQLSHMALTFNTLVREKMVRHLIEDQMAKGELNWQAMSSWQMNRIILVIAAFPGLISSINLLSQIDWLLQHFTFDHILGNEIATKDHPLQDHPDFTVYLSINQKIKFLPESPDPTPHNIVDIATKQPPSPRQSKWVTESTEATIKISPKEDNPNDIPAMTKDAELQTMWMTQKAWQLFARENNLDTEALTITKTTDPLELQEGTLAIEINVNPEASQKLSIKQMLKFYLSLINNPNHSRQ